MGWGGVLTRSCLDGTSPCFGAQEYLQRYLYILLSPQGLSLKVLHPEQPLQAPPLLSPEDCDHLSAIFAGAC